MGRQIHPVVVLLALLLAVVAVVMVYGRRLQEPPRIAVTPRGGATMRERSRETMSRRMARGMVGQGTTGAEAGGTRPGSPSPPGQDADLGLTWEPSMSPRGIKVTEFDSPPGTSPLELMGVEPGDVIVSCNGESQTVRVKVVEALKALRDNGTPFAIVVRRDGEQLTLRGTKEVLSPAR